MDEPIDVGGALERAKVTRRELEETRRELEEMRIRRNAPGGLRDQVTKLLTDCRETRHRAERAYGRILGERLPDAEPVDNARWFDFLLEHPELTGWNTP